VANIVRLHVTDREILGKIAMDFRAITEKPAMTSIDDREE
jgi:hypothetical protein